MTPSPIDIFGLGFIIASILVGIYFLLDKIAKYFNKRLDIIFFIMLIIVGIIATIYAIGGIAYAWYYDIPIEEMNNF